MARRTRRGGSDDKDVEDDNILMIRIVFHC